MRSLLGLWVLLSACGTPQPSRPAAAACPTDMVAALKAHASPTDTVIARTAANGSDRCQFVRKDLHAQP